MKIDRRSLLKSFGAAGAIPAVATAAQSGTVAFLHGVASGDPSTTAAIFWTRVTPADAASGAIPVVLAVATILLFRLPQDEILHPLEQLDDGDVSGADAGGDGTANEAVGADAEVRPERE